MGSKGLVDHQSYHDHVIIMAPKLTAQLQRMYHVFWLTEDRMNMPV